MATLYVTEFRCGTNNNVPGDYPVLPAIGTQTVTFTTSAATSNALSAACEIVAISASAAAHITMAATPTATTSMMYIPANTVHYFKVGQSGMKIAAVAAA